MTAGKATPQNPRQGGRWSTISEIGSVLLVSCTVLFVGARFVGEAPVAGQMVVWVAYVAMVLVIQWWLRARGQGWSHLGLVFARPSSAAVRKAAWQSLVVLVAALAAFVLGSIVGGALFGLPKQADFSRYNPLEGNLPLLLIALPGVWLASSLGEEIVFRGFLITRLSELGAEGRSSRRWGVAVSAVLFGLAHYAWGPTGMLQTACMGLAMGASYLLVGRNLWVTVLAHMVMDTLLLVPMYLGQGTAG